MLRCLAVSLALLFAAGTAFADVTVTVGHTRIEPAQVKIKKGESVIFHNVDEMPGGHTIVADDGSFASPPLAKGQDFIRKFENSGTVKIHIQQHPNTTGAITVE